MEAIAEFLKISYSSDYDSGYDSGYGSGYGSGSGYSSGSGTGDSSGDGFGYGSVSGSGSGTGSGSGDGSGDGYGLKKFNNHPVHYIDSIPTIIYSVKGQIAKGVIINSDLTLKDCYIAKVGNFFAHGKTIEKAILDAQEKYNENRPLEDRITDFVSEFNGTDKYPTSEFYKWHTTLTGSCSFGKDQFVESIGIDLNGKITVMEFIELTKDQYGSDAIKQLAKKYSNL